MPAMPLDGRGEGLGRCPLERSAGQRMERLVLEVLAYHKENSLQSIGLRVVMAIRAQLEDNSRAQGSDAQRHRAGPARRH